MVWRCVLPQCFCRVCASERTGFDYAAICFLHLREIGPARLWLKGAVVTTVLATAIAAQTLQRSEAFSDFGRQTTTRLLMPPALRAVPVRDQGVFFGEIAHLKARIDGDRSQARPDPANQ